MAAISFHHTNLLLWLGIDIHRILHCPLSQYMAGDADKESSISQVGFRCLGFIELKVLVQVLKRNIEQMVCRRRNELSATSGQIIAEIISLLNSNPYLYSFQQGFHLPGFIYLFLQKTPGENGFWG